MKRAHPSHRSRRSARGFTLVELLVAVALGMVLTLALATVMIRHDAGKRTLVSSNDLALNTAYISYTLDRDLRSAGSGFVQSAPETFGCMLRVARGGTQILPRGAAFPAPFAALPQQVRLAPLVIHAGAGAGGSDVLAVATGSSSLGETPVRVRTVPAVGAQLNLTSTLGLRANDIVLVADETLGCVVQQIDSGFVGGSVVKFGTAFVGSTDQPVDFSGTYAKSTIDGVALADFASSDRAVVALLGNTGGNPPMLRFIGIGNDATLFSYDVLRLDGNDTVQPLAAGVVDMRALYGVDTNADGVIDDWVAPTDANFTAAALTAFTASAQQRVMTIMAVRVGLVLRSDRVEREDVAPASIALFADLPAAVHYSYAIASGDRRQRYQGVEFTVPLRNVMLRARNP